ncbi:MAG TPA: alpha-amylase family protein, partial [Tepidisphaeraceae bacterium]
MAKSSKKTDAGPAVARPSSAARPPIGRWPARQVHLDFHTSEHVPDVGARFSRRQFQKALRLGRVNAINLFAKCHHSWSYYPTQFGCGPHPRLAIDDLLGEQIEACHAIGVRCPIYYTVGWSATDAAQHPEWTVRRRDGSIHSFNFDPTARPDEPRPAVSWQFLCPSGGYLGLMLDQTREICQRYDVDGMWYDICNTESCWCDNCRRGMREAGLDPEDDVDAKRYAVRKWVTFMAAANTAMRERVPDGTIFFNGVAFPTTPGEIHAQQSHFELEDLPTTWGGYDKFPPRARYMLGLPEKLGGGGGVDENGAYKKPVIAMSGKFHTSWGEFGGFKHPDAIRFEAASMVAYGGMCCFGDQLHPSGEMDLSTYANIGAAYEYVERIEDYGVVAQPTANLGVFFSQRPTGGVQYASGGDGHDNGVCTMLLEAHVDFDAAHRGADWSRFETVILTGGRCLERADVAQVKAYVERGGRLLVIGDSVFGADTGRPVLDV